MMVGFWLMESLDGGRTTAAVSERALRPLPQRVKASSPLQAAAASRSAQLRPARDGQPNCTERRVKEPIQNPSIGKRTSAGATEAAPCATMAGTKCSTVGSDIATPGARLR
jgi:hypothetical protein